MDEEERLVRIERRLKRVHSELQWLGLSTFFVLLVVGAMAFSFQLDARVMLYAVCNTVEATHLSESHDDVCPREVFE